MGIASSRVASAAPTPISPAEATKSSVSLIATAKIATDKEICESGASIAAVRATDVSQPLKKRCSEDCQHEYFWCQRCDFAKFSLGEPRFRTCQMYPCSGCGDPFICKPDCAPLEIKVTSTLTRDLRVCTRCRERCYKCGERSSADNCDRCASPMCTKHSGHHPTGRFKKWCLNCLFNICYDCFEPATHMRLISSGSSSSSIQIKSGLGPHSKRAIFLQAVPAFYVTNLCEEHFKISEDDGEKKDESDILSDDDDEKKVGDKSGKLEENNAETRLHKTTIAQQWLDLNAVVLVSMDANASTEHHAVSPIFEDLMDRMKLLPSL